MLLGVGFAAVLRAAKLATCNKNAAGVVPPAPPPPHPQGWSNVTYRDGLLSQSGPGGATNLRGPPCKVHGGLPKLT